MNHNFGEKKIEKYYDEETKKTIELEVWQTPKYLEAKDKAIKLIESDQYKDVLKDGDFWILMNKTKNGKMNYTGLIVTHNACIKINDMLPKEKKFKPQCFKYEKEEYAHGLIGIYQDEEIYEFGEVSSKNCKNQYPYAMLLKRCFDRVVLKKSGIAQWGIYSDSEAEEFKEPDRNSDDLVEEFRSFYTDAEERTLLERYKVTEIKDLGSEILEKYINHKKYGKEQSNKD